MLDVHSHKNFGENVIHNILPKEWSAFSKKYPQQLVSVGIHPWDVKQSSLKENLELLSTIVGNKQVYAIGETGLDKRCSSPFNLQILSLENHIRLSEEYEKPLILHCVAAYNELQLLKRKYHPKQRWILHGFRGNPILAKQLIEDDFFFSIGWNFNTETIKILPEEKIYFETDELDMSIEEIRTKVNDHRK